MPLKVEEFNGGVALTSIQDGDIAYLIRSGTDQFAQMETVREYMGGLMKLDVTVSAAQIATANSTPINIIPAPGANKYIRLISVDRVRNYGGTAYTGGGTAVLRYASGDTLSIAAFSLGGTLTIREPHPFIITPDDLPEYPLNSAVQFRTSSDDATGNSDERFVGYYTIIDLS
jgi:hypothetical protein